MKKKLGYGVLLGVALIAVSACGSGSPTAPSTNPPPTSAAPPTSPAPAPPTGSSTFEDEVLTLTNRRRAEGATCGGTLYPPVSPLTLDLRLREAARRHSHDMAANNFFSHTGSDGSTSSTRASQSGYSGGYLGENIVAGRSSAQAAVDAWMQSTGHCQNIMNGRYRALGVGYAFSSSSAYQHYATQVFGGG